MQCIFSVFFSRSIRYSSPSSPVPQGGQPVWTESRVSCPLTCSWVRPMESTAGDWRERGGRRVAGGIWYLPRLRVVAPGGPLSFYVWGQGIAFAFSASLYPIHSVYTAYVLSYFSPVQLFVTLWTITHQAPLSMGFSRQEYWSGLLCPPPGDLPNPGTESASLISSA